MLAGSASPGPVAGAGGLQQNQLRRGLIDLYPVRDGASSPQRIAKGL